MLCCKLGDQPNDILTTRRDKVIQTGPIQRLAFLKRNAGLCCGSIQVVFSHFFNTSTSGGVCTFLSTVMISHVGKLGMFPGMSQTAVSFSIRDFVLFLDTFGVFTLLTNSHSAAD